MGVRILHDNRDEIAVLYCSTSDWAFGPVFYTADDGTPPGEQAEAFCGWFTSGSAASVARELGITVIGTAAALGFDGTDPREYTSRDLESLYNVWVGLQKALHEAEEEKPDVMDAFGKSRPHRDFQDYGLDKLNRDQEEARGLK